MFIDFQGTHFTVITDDKGKPWFIAKELCDYLELKDQEGHVKTFLIATSNI
jgi:prophage antirepressor-like protein